MYRVVILALSSMLLVPFAAVAAVLALDDCLTLALEENADVIQARLARWLARDQIDVVSGAYDTVLQASAAYEDSELPSQYNPYFEASESLMMNAEIGRTFMRGTRLAVGVDSSQSSSQASELVPFPSDIYSSIFRVSASQPLLNNAWGALNRNRQAAAEFRYGAAASRYEQTRQAVAGLVHAVFWEAYASQKLFEANTRGLDWSRALLEVHRKRVADNLMDETDLLAAEAALATREVEVLSSGAYVDRTREMLFDIIGLPPVNWEETTLAFPDERGDWVAGLQLDAVAYVGEALAMRADLAALEFERSAAESEIAIARQSARPNLAVAGSYGVGSAGEEEREMWGTDRQMWMVGLQFDLPLERSAEKGRLRQAQRQVEMWEARYQQAVRHVEMEVRDAVRRLDTAHQLVRATRRARDLHDAKWQAEARKLEQGRSVTQIVIRYQEDLEHAEAALVTAWAGYEQARASLALARGSLVPWAEDGP